MIIHLSVLLVIILVSCAYSPKETYLKSRNTSYIMPITPWLIVFGYLAFLSAARSGMNDTPVYISSFENLEAGWNAAVNTLTGAGKDRGFDALASIFKEYVSDNYHLWFLFFSVIESICFIRVYRKESYSLSVSCYFFFASALYYNYFSMMRQWFAVTLVFSGFKWLKEKRVVPYILLCVLAAQFHASAYLCIIFYFLVQGKPWNKKQNCIWVLAAVGVIFWIRYLW